ncbi:toluene tolerance protein [Litchfieldella qijiaojingensis]|uniref:Toluene tolerance protein n=2 Tax=Litchfieldella qijiaojingensis TaxID=980347 RepID=A0ABQ2Z462_9GAMM|nr:toluene tolerance protein [Halomonas qijiaojingensis]
MASIAPGASASTAAATTIVSDLHEALIESMKAGSEISYEERYEQLQPVIERTHHFPYIARFVLGRYASRLEREEQQQFLEVFRRLSVATYASRFDNYNGERFQHVSSREVSPGRMVVRTVLVTSKGTRVQLDYLLLRRDDRWAIVNVLADGVSDLALRRSEYAWLLQNEGFMALLEELHRQIDDLAQRS